MSSGSRLNRPSDDVAAFGRAVGLESQTRGLRQAALNINQGIGMLSAAEASAQSGLDIVQQMRELAVQAASGTLSSNQREAIATQLSSLQQEYQRIVQATEFNSRDLLQASQSIRLQTGSNSGDVLNLEFESLLQDNVFQKNIGTGNFSLIDSFSTNTTFSAGEQSNGLQVADFNGDGNLDFVVAQSGTTDQLSIFLGDGQGGAQLSQTLATPSDSTGIDLGDINEDGIVDLLYAEDGLAGFALGRGDGFFDEIVSFGLSVSSARQAQAKDVDGDGINELLVSDRDTGEVLIFKNDGQENFNLMTSFVVSGTNLVDLEFVDLDNDSDLDAIGTTNSGFEVFLNDGEANFSIQDSDSYGSGSRALASGDFNNDGYLDFVNQLSGSNAFFVNLNIQTSRGVSKAL